MNLEALSQNIIGKVPEDFKVLLVHAIENAKSSQEFLHRAESICWVAFPNPILNSIESSAKSVRLNNNNQKSEQKCLLHGPGTYLTENCFKIVPFCKREKATRLRGQKARKTQNSSLRKANNLTITEDGSQGNGNGLIYRLSTLTANHSPFFTERDNVEKNSKFSLIQARIYL